MSIQILGANGVPINADAGSNAQRVTLYDTSGNLLTAANRAVLPASPTGMPVMGINDSNYTIVRTDRIGSLRVGQDTLLFRDSIEGSNLNTQIWTNTNGATYTTAQTNNAIDLNSSNNTVSSGYNILTSNRQFAKTALAPFHLRMRLKVVPATNTTVEFGFGNPTTNTAQVPTGALWRYTSGGLVYPVICFNGADTAIGTDISSSLASINYYTWGIVVDDDNINFFCQDASTGRLISSQTLQITLTQQKTFSATHVPLFVRHYNTVFPATTPSVRVGDCMLVGKDLLTYKTWQHQQSAVGNSSDISPTIFGQTGNYTNSAAPANATLSNTTPSYATLGGMFQFAAVAGATTDYALFGYTVPSPYSLYVTGIRISLVNSGAAAATTATIFQWGVGVNGTTTSLAAVTAVRTTLGYQALLVGAAIGTVPQDLDCTFDVPLRTDPGRTFFIILRMPVGTATASQVILGQAQVRGYFE